MTLPTRRNLLATSMLLAATAAPAFAQGAKEQAAHLFKVITVRAEVTIGLSAAELAGLGGDAGAIAKALVAKGTLDVWQYAVRKGQNGDLEQAPLRKIGLI